MSRVNRRIAMQSGDLKVLLTSRELEVLSLIAQGATSKEIGTTLGISRKTADAHRDNIKKKLHADSIAQLVQCAILIGLIKPTCPLDNFLPPPEDQPENQLKRTH